MSNPSVLEKRLAQIYQEGRAFVEHEDDLVDRRLKWVITISAFLFAAYGGSLIASANVEDTDQATLLSVSRISMGVFGVMSATIGATSIHAAHLAIKAVARKYGNFVLNNAEEIRKQKLHVWKLIGDSLSQLKGFSSSLIQPYLIAGVWAALVVFEFRVLVIRHFVWFDTITHHIVSASIDQEQLGKLILFCVPAFWMHLMLVYKKNRIQLVISSRVSSEIHASRQGSVEISELTILSEQSFKKKL